MKNEHCGQKAGRNSNSNLLRTFFRRLQIKLKDSPEILDAVIQKHGINIIPESFVLWYERNKADYRNYLRIPAIRRLFFTFDVS
jgi:hypothetical protein